MRDRSLRRRLALSVSLFGLIVTSASGPRRKLRRSRRPLGPHPRPRRRPWPRRHRLRREPRHLPPVIRLRVTRLPLPGVSARGLPAATSRLRVRLSDPHRGSRRVSRTRAARCLRAIHVEERARRGPVIAGAVVFGVPYVLGLAVASTENFPNSTGWLVVPALGPWITLAARHRSGFEGCTDAVFSSCNNDDSTTRTFLVLDGLTQATGAILFIYGLSSTKKVMARNFVGSLHLAPARIGRDGYGGFCPDSSKF